MMMTMVNSGLKGLADITLLSYGTSGVSRNKLRGFSDFQETIQQQGPMGGGGACPSQKFEHINIKLKIVRFRGIFAVERRYEILVEMSDF